MKRLLIVRHGKSSWGYENVADIDRPLKNKGVKNGYEIAGRLAENNMAPDIILSSPAIRALHTAMVFTRVCKLPLKQLEIKEELYFGNETEIAEIIKESSDEIGTLMIVGHNPTFTSLANLFIKDDIDNVPTTGVVNITFETNFWKKITKELVTGFEFDYPKKES
ncbi:MAG: histidine phosphatase family protein [Bacteroidales bacterium]|nr:histidine phosphatase family protein [Bacteroidales bacterium]